ALGDRRLRLGGARLHGPGNPGGRRRAGGDRRPGRAGAGGGTRGGRPGLRGHRTTARRGRRRALRRVAQRRAPPARARSCGGGRAGAVRKADGGDARPSGGNGGRGARRGHPVRYRFRPAAPSGARRATGCPAAGRDRAAGGGAHRLRLLGGPFVVGNSRQRAELARGPARGGRRGNHRPRAPRLGPNGNAARSAARRPAPDAPAAHPRLSGGRRRAAGGARCRWHSPLAPRFLQLPGSLAAAAAGGGGRDGATGGDRYDGADGGRLLGPRGRADGGGRADRLRRPAIALRGSGARLPRGGDGRAARLFAGARHSADAPFPLRARGGAQMPL
ncbi:MAG: Oxidoreductase, Gfo/Idh/MocA family, partial [uncultured Sphingomonadaceae bacterium]